MPAKSKAQQQFMGMVHACQKYGKCASSEVSKTAKSIKADDAEDFASTKHKGLPKRKEKNKMSHNEGVAGGALKGAGAGALGGAATGAFLGSALGPVGTVAGGLAGGALGTVAGAPVGAAVGATSMKKGMKKGDKKKKMKEHTTFREYASWCDQHLSEEKS